jgi:ADP-ribosylglycohydrolase
LVTVVGTKADLTSEITIRPNLILAIPFACFAIWLLWRSGSVSGWVVLLLLGCWPGSELMGLLGSLATIEWLQHSGLCGITPILCAGVLWRWSNQSDDVELRRSVRYVVRILVWGILPIVGLTLAFWFVLGNPPSTFSSGSGFFGIDVGALPAWRRFAAVLMLIPMVFAVLAYALSPFPMMWTARVYWEKRAKADTGRDTIGPNDPDAPRPPTDRDRFLGCLLGCAVGDALGAPLEGLWSHQIPKQRELLAGFRPVEGYPLGQYTDDTQLTVATVKAIVKAGDVSPHAIAKSVARLWARESVVGPGGACTRAAHMFLAYGDWMTCGAPVGQAGNGTAMRTAVLGLYFLKDAERLSQAAADVSRITHHDPRSIAGGVAIAKAAHQLATSPEDSPNPFCQAIADAMEPWEADFADRVRELPHLLSLSLDEALPSIAWAGSERPEFRQPIITPFVIPTVMAALWCVLRHGDCWSTAVASAIRLGGDVDTLGAIVGALMGAKLGVQAIPAHLVAGVLDSGRLQRLAVRYHALAIGHPPTDNQ